MGRCAEAAFTIEADASGTIMDKTRCRYTCPPGMTETDDERKIGPEALGGNVDFLSGGA